LTHDSLVGADLADPDTVDTMGRFVQQAHQRDLRVKAYFTVRELTLRAAEGAEFWAATSLGDEVSPQFSRRLLVCKPSFA
jgi:hypothetical protein